MILIGQYDSPFVRRVAIALHLYGIAYEHRPWSTFGDADKLATLNPLRRVPVLVLDDGEALIESSAILDHLDEIAGPDRAMLPRSGAPRRHALKLCALASGLADKAVALLYERIMHPETSDLWVTRCQTQIAGVLDALEQARAAAATPWLMPGDIGHADIMLGTALRFVREAHPGAFDDKRWPALTRHAATCEALPAFQANVQILIPPA